MSALKPELLAAMFGLAGAIVGALATIAGQIGAAFISAHLALKRQRALDAPREELLRRMLEDGLRHGDKMRRLRRLSLAIGASEEETARLLVSIKARGDISDGAASDPKWGLISAIGYPGYKD